MASSPSCGLSVSRNLINVLLFLAHIFRGCKSVGTRRVVINKVGCLLTRHGIQASSVSVFPSMTGGGGVGARRDQLK